MSRGFARGRRGVDEVAEMEMAPPRRRLSSRKTSQPMRAATIALRITGDIPLNCALQPRHDEL